MSARGRCATPGRRTAERQATVGGAPWPLPVALLGFAALAQVAGAGALVVCAPDLARGIGYGPAQLGAVHLLGLAFLSVAIVGALLQLVPVLLRQPLGAPARRAGRRGAGRGTWALAAGLWSGRGTRSPRRDPARGRRRPPPGRPRPHPGAGPARRDARRPRRGHAASGLWFAVVLAVGAMMAANRIHPFLEVDRTRLMAAHAAIAIVGWIGGTIVAVALRLAPMFALSHGYRRGPGVAALAAWHASVVPIAVGLGWGMAWLAAAGGALLLCACGLAGWYVRDVARHRRRRLEAPLVHLSWASPPRRRPSPMLAAWAGPWDPYRAVIPATVLALVGMGAGITSGHLFKVVPMLVWTGRFAALAGTPGAPRLADLYPAPLAAAEQASFAAGLLLLTGGVASAGSAPLARAGAVLLVAAALAVAAAIAACVLRGAGPRDAAHLSIDPFTPTPEARS